MSQTLQPPQHRNASGLGYSDFARHYFRNRGFFLFLQVLRWFTSLGSLVPAYVFSGPFLRFAQVGFPIRKSPDITPVCGSPKLIAACHVLHRLSLPRHPPCALSSLTIELTPAQGRITSVLCGWLTYLRLEIDRALTRYDLSPKDTLHNSNIVATFAFLTECWAANVARPCIKQDHLDLVLPNQFRCQRTCTLLSRSE